MIPTARTQFRAEPGLMQTDAQEQHLSPKAVELTEARAQSIRPNLRNTEVPQTEHTSNCPPSFLLARPLKSKCL